MGLDSPREPWYVSRLTLDSFIHSALQPSAIYKHFLTTYYMPALVCSPGDSSWLPLMEICEATSCKVSPNLWEKRSPIP